MKWEKKQVGEKAGGTKPLHCSRKKIDKNKFNDREKTKCCI
jgi:hypothetical protein